MTPWDHLRAALIALALVANGIYALPLPPAVRRDQLDDHREDLDLWVGLLRKVGIELTREELGERVVVVTAEIDRGHKLLKAPFRPVFDLLGANQAWALFASASTRPDRLEVQVRAQGSEEWETLLRRMDPCCTWSEGQLEYRRIRGVWDGQGDKMRPAYKGLSRWIAARVFEERPDAEEVRVRLLRGYAKYPWEKPDPRMESVLVRTHLREDLEGADR